ncbi:MAG: sugar phosphate isomerase/epimerase [Verrucomicrobia bacterium]|nr:sugar phosphate isomerase/epimerase [Verrucomicrobiota bacterium]
MDFSHRRIGVGSWTFPWALGTVSEHMPTRPMTLVDLAHKAHQLGVGVVQVLDNATLERRSADEIDGLRGTAEQHQLALEIGTRGVTPEHLYRFLRLAGRVDARLVRTTCGWQGENRPLDEVEQDLREVLPAYAAAGITIALENYEAYPTRALGALVERIGDPHLGICLDLTNSYGALESTERMLAALAPHTVNVHLKDFVIERTPRLLGFTFRGRPLGQGFLPVEEILAALTAHQREPNFIVELWTPFQADLQSTRQLEEDWAEQSVRYLKQLAFFDE